MERFRHIVFATDFSERSRPALAWSVRVAEAHGARLTVVHAIEGGASDIPDALDLERAATESLDAEVESIRGRVEDVAAVCSRGHPPEIIVKTAARRDADLVVIGMRGRGSPARAGLGSTAERVIRTATVPVLAIHDGAGCETPQLRRILVAGDFSTEAETAAHAGLRLAVGFGDEPVVTVLHACDVPADFGHVANPSDLTRMLAVEEEAARERLEAWVDRHFGAVHELELVVRQGYAASLIDEEARQRSVDLIVVGTHGRSGVSRLLLGSVAERVLRHAHCPVLIAHDPSPNGTPAATRAGAETTDS